MFLIAQHLKDLIDDLIARTSNVEKILSWVPTLALEDFTVLCVLHADGPLVAFDHFSELDRVFQRKRIVQLAHRYEARLLIDSTGFGDPVCDELYRENVRVEGYKFTNATKKDLIENLSIMIEKQQLTIPNIPQLINELKLYGYKTTASGNVQYGTPEGYHDDCVVALALAAWQLKRSPPSGNRRRLRYLLNQVFQKLLLRYFNAPVIKSNAPNKGKTANQESSGTDGDAVGP